VVFCTLSSLREDRPTSSQWVFHRPLRYRQDDQPYEQELTGKQLDVWSRHEILTSCPAQAMLYTA